MEKSLLLYKIKFSSYNDRFMRINIENEYSNTFKKLWKNYLNRFKYRCIKIKMENLFFVSYKVFKQQCKKDRFMRINTENWKRWDQVLEY